ncbi:hypothetical protein BH11BAC1_BH11BAC1_24570 [soil metagenome]
MKKILVLLCMAFATIAFAQQSQDIKPKLSPLTKKYLRENSATGNRSGQMQGYAYRKHADGNTFLCALIKVSNETAAQQSLNAIGAIVGTKAGNIWTVQIPPQQINEFIQANGISYIQLDEPVYPVLNMARQTTRVDSVQNGFSLPMPYSGKEVIMGVIDFGFDYNHPTFYDTLHSGYRIKRVWELNGVGIPPPGYSYGNEITDTLLIKSQGTDDARQMHGTSTAGIAAGSGYGSNATNTRFRGMAYEADYVLVGVRRDTIESQWMQGSFSDFLDGVNYIFNYAATAGKPAVVNISWGSQSGPHDGTTLFNQACDNLSGPGKIIVMSAGNEGTEKIHLSKTFTASDTLVNTFLTFSSQVYKRTWVDVWGDTGKTVCGQVTLFSNGIAGNTTNFSCIDDSVHDQILIGANGVDTCFVQFISSSADFNGKPRMTIDIYNKASDSVGVSLKANDGSIDVWDEYYYYGFPYGYSSAFDSLQQSWAVNGNTISTVSDMGSAQSVLLVGAYASKVAFSDINGNSWTYSSYVLPGRLVPFSSRGPMTDGRIKPDINAPGLTLATSVSSYDSAYTPTGANSALVISGWLDTLSNQTYYYAEFSGTSASSPCAAGIVALLLQANPLLNPQQIKDLVAATAITDTYTGVIPPQGTNNWGHGKINAYGAMKLLLQQMVGVYNFVGEKLDCVLFPNPNSGSFTLNYSGEKEGVLRIEVYNMTGGLLKSDSWHVSQGLNQKQLDFTTAAQENLVVRVSSEKGYVNIKTIVSNR